MTVREEESATDKNDETTVKNRHQDIPCAGFGFSRWRVKLGIGSNRPE